MAPSLTGPSTVATTHTPTIGPSGAGGLMDRLDGIDEESSTTEPTSGGASEVEKAIAVAEEETSDNNELAETAEKPVKSEAKPEDKTEEKPEEEPEVEAKGEEEKTDEEAPAVETIKADDGSEVPANAIFTKKVDGKDTKISLKELLDDFSGKTAVKNRFAEVNTLKQKVENQQKKIATDLAKVTTTVTKFLDSAKAGHHRDAMDALCELTGADPEKAWAEQKAASEKQIQEYFSMTPEERILSEREQEASYWKRQATKDKPNELQQVTLEKRIAQELTDGAKKHGLNAQELRDGNRLVLDLVDKGLYTKEEINTEVVLNESLNLKIWGQIDNFCKESLPEMHGKPEFYREVLKDTRERGISKAEWSRLFNELKGQTTKPQTKSVTSTLADKVKKTSSFSSKTQATKSKNTGKSDEDWDPVSFDEI